VCISLKLTKYHISSLIHYTTLYTNRHTWAHYPPNHTTIIHTLHTHVYIWSFKHSHIQTHTHTHFHTHTHTQLIGENNRNAIERERTRHRTLTRQTMYSTYPGIIKTSYGFAAPCKGRRSGADYWLRSSLLTWTLNCDRRMSEEYNPGALSTSLDSPCLWTCISGIATAQHRWPIEVCYQLYTLTLFLVWNEAFDTQLLYPGVNPLGVILRGNEEWSVDNDKVLLCDLFY
jgi:hypothetical protein